MPSEMTIKKVPRVIDLYCTPEDIEKLAVRVKKHAKSLRIGDDTLVEYIHGKGISIAVRIDQDRNWLVK